MDDLISRQAVIDLLKKNTTRDIEEVVVIEKNIKLIMDMPKAFDVDAVVEDIEELWKQDVFSKAQLLYIVKAGGMDG